MIVNGELPATARVNRSPAKAGGAPKVKFGSGCIGDGHGFFDRQIEEAAKDVERTRKLEAKYKADHEKVKAAANAARTKEVHACRSKSHHADINRSVKIFLNVDI